jgi:ATP-dependent DNA helicase RecG
MKERILQLEQWMEAKEDEHLEFKEAKNKYDFEKLVQYSVAFANEGGGKIILGVTDKRPRKIVGTQAFMEIEKTKSGLMDRIPLRIDVEEILQPQGRVLVFHIPSRPKGVPIHYKGRYLMRSGEDLAPMRPDMLKRIFDEVEPDYTAEICKKATFSDLDVESIEEFRKRWIQKTKNEKLKNLTMEQLLIDAELMSQERLTYAALILFGTREALGRLLPQSEVIFEYRSSDVTGPAQQREEFRQGFFSFYEDLWTLINKRNDLQHFKDGFFIWDIPTFNEGAVREAVLNAVSHRDYRMPGSVFIRQYSRRMEIASPGGFPPGITPENILWQQAPRNRRIAETFARCGLVERSGQGMNRIFESCIKESKQKPDFSNTDDYNVWLTLHGEVQHTEFLRFLEKLGEESLQSFTTKDLLVIDHVFKEERVPDQYRDNLFRLIESGIIERVSRGKGSRYILSRRFYSYLGKRGEYTRKRGLDRETNKALLLNHIQLNNKKGSAFKEFIQVLPSLSQNQIKSLIKELKSEGSIYCVGKTRSAIWFIKEDNNTIGSKPDNIPNKTQS